MKKDDLNSPVVAVPCDVLRTILEITTQHMKHGESRKGEGVNQRDREETRERKD